MGHRWATTGPPSANAVSGSSGARRVVQDVQWRYSRPRDLPARNSKRKRTKRKANRPFNVPLSASLHARMTHYKCQSASQQKLQDSGNVYLVAQVAPKKARKARDEIFPTLLKCFLFLGGILQDLWKWQLDLPLHLEVPALTIPRLVIFCHFCR